MKGHGRLVKANWVVVVLLTLCGMAPAELSAPDAVSKLDKVMKYVRSSKFGGAGLTVMEQFIFSEEMALARAPQPPLLRPSK